MRFSSGKIRTDMNRYTFGVPFVSMVFLSLAACANKIIETPEKIARTMAQIVIEQDKKAFARYAVNQEGYFQIIQLQLESEKVSGKGARRISQLRSRPGKIIDLEQVLLTVKSGRHKKVALINSRINASFGRLIKYAKRDGVDLSKASFGKIISASSRKFHKLVQYNIYFTITAGSGDYLIRLKAVTAIPGRFYLLGNIKWRGKYRK